MLRPRRRAAARHRYAVPLLAGTVERFWEFLHQFKADRRLVAALMLANLAGIVFGYYYYWDVGQFNPATTCTVDHSGDSCYDAPWWWPFLADSPNAVLLLSISLVLYQFGRRSRLLDSLAFIANIQVGLWTTFLFLSYPDQLGTWDWGSTNNILFFAHMGMPLEALVLARDLRNDPIPWWMAGAVVAWFGANLAFDYLGDPWPHIHPAPFIDGHQALGPYTTIMTTVVVAAWFALVWPGLTRVRHATRAREGEATRPEP